MQWRSLVLALLALRLAGHALLWLAGPSVGFYQQRLRAFVCSPAAAAQEAASNRRCFPAGLAAPHWASLLGRAWGGSAGSGGGGGGGSSAGRDGSLVWSGAEGGGGDDDEYEQRYSRAFPPQLRGQLRDAARRMFAFGYDNYMAHAFPQDELNPIDCRGRGPDRDDP